jgi:hypothetical protein
LLPLVRCALVLEDIDPIVRLLGVFYAVLEKDAKRMLGVAVIIRVECQGHQVLIIELSTSRKYLQFSTICAEAHGTICLGGGGKSA